MVVGSESSKGLESPSPSLNRPRSSFVHPPAKGSALPKTRMLSAAKNPARDDDRHENRLQSTPRHAASRFHGVGIASERLAPF